MATPLEPFGPPVTEDFNRQSDLTVGYAGAAFFKAGSGATTASGTEARAVIASGLFTGYNVAADRTGAAAGTSTTSATVVGSEGHSGIVAASITSTGTAVGGEAHTGTVTASIASTAIAIGAMGHSGTATASITSSGTTVGNEAHAGTASATATSSGTESGTKGALGGINDPISSTATVAGTKFESGGDSRFGASHGHIDSSGTVVGNEHHSGTVFGTITSTGTVGPEVTSGGHGGGVYAQHMGPGRGSPIIRRSGGVRATTTVVSRQRGRRGHMGTATGSCTIVSHLRSSTARAGRSWATMPSRAEIRGAQTDARDSEYLALYSELRRLRDDRDLLLML